MIPNQEFIGVPAVNGLTEREEARFVALWKKPNTSVAEMKEFRRLKFKRWRPDNRYRRNIVAHAEELFERLETLANLHDGIADGGDGILSEDWDEVRATIGKIRKARNCPIATKAAKTRAAKETHERAKVG